ncbi:MAG TPA: hypothetical protein PKD10_13430 [Paracoccaceae bacterium]|nr:hypothetical protein [Paracoccaceae bacterium]HMO70727.1 hypothetical protein [Paracoccaceae bacterium]
MTRSLPSLTARLARRLRRFRRDTGGYMLVEAVLIVPFLLWGYIALYSYWDAYRSMTNLQKVAYTASDLISREQRPVNAAYMTGIRNTMNAMLGSGQIVDLRITQVMWSEIEDRFVVEWSNSPTGMIALTTETLAGVRHRIPDMGDGRTAIIVEAAVEYTPSLSLGVGALPGLQPTTFEEFIVTPPRYAPRVVFQ